MKSKNLRARVFLVGAGPGPSDLMTLRAHRLIESADVILYDALVGEDCIAGARADAQLVHVGKLGRGDFRTPQHTINELLVEHARAGKCVVRLKGGDPSVFGRAGEEIRYMAERGIDAEIVPGISSALAAPLRANLAITHRDVASHFTVATGHRKGEPPPIEHFCDVLKASGTLVLLMAARTGPAIASHMIACGAPPETPVASVFRACAHDESIERMSLSELAKRERLNAPTTLILGHAAANDRMMTSLHGRKYSDTHSIG